MRLVGAGSTPRVVEVLQEEPIDLNPERLAGLPGRLHALFRAVEQAAQQRLPQFVAELLTPPEPPAEQAPAPPEPGFKLVPVEGGFQLVSDGPDANERVPEEYLPPVNLPLLDPGLGLTPSLVEGPTPIA